MVFDHTQNKESHTSEKRINTIFSFVFINILRNILGIFRNKILAITYGASSIGLLGQFLNFDGILGKLVLFGTTASLVNTYNDAERLKFSKNVIVIANFVLVASSGFVNLSIVFLFASFFANVIYLDEGYKYLIYLGILLNIVYVSSTFAELIFQARQQFNSLFKARLIGIIAGVLTLYPLIVHENLAGVIINSIILYLATFIYLLSNSGFLKKTTIEKAIDALKNLKYLIIQNIFKVTIADLTRTIIVYGSLLLIRIIIIQNLGEVKAGYYHALMSISNYLNIILEGFIVYYYPVICASSTREEIQNETNVNFEILLYMTFPIIILLGVFSNLFLSILYTDEFSEVSRLLSVLVGTKILYVYYYFFSINFLAKNHLKKFVTIEFVKSILLLTMTSYLINVLGLEGAVYAIVLTEIGSFLLIWYVKKNLSEFKLGAQNQKHIWYLIIIVSFIISHIFSPIYMFIIAVVLFLSLFDIKKYLTVFKIIRNNIIKS